MRILFLNIILLMILPAGMQAQELILLESGNRMPVEGAFIKAHFPASGNADYFVSDKDGKVFLPGNDFPVVLSISHISFRTHADTLTRNESLEILLNRTVKNLDEVVVTGQYEPQSAANSVFKIKSIDKVEIQNRGAKNLEDVLTTTLNVRLQNDAATGTTSLSLQGISGENVKILIDGVPVTGRVGGQIDINQFDINQIEKIEIVEGPMAVNYGSNAMGGVINIITKKSVSGKWSGNIALTEETVGSEYGLDKGIHNQSISGGVNFGHNFLTQGSFTHNYFGGYKGSGTERSYQWDPKEQFMGSLMFKYAPEKWRMFYKLDALHEVIDSRGEPTGIVNPIALDEEYTTIRFIHQVQVGTKLSSSSRLNALFSYTDYDRLKNQYVTNLTTGEKPLSRAEGANDTTYFDNFNFRGSVVKTLPSSKVSYELGYDINLENGQGGRIAGSERKSINDFGFYGSTEISGGNWKFRPGLRVAYNTQYSTPVIPSINVKWQKQEWTTQFAYGRGFRAPNLKELHLEFVDASHTIFGNPDLSPEDGHHLDAGLTLSKTYGAKTIKYNADIFFNSIDNRIDFGQSPQDATVTTYINIDKFRSVGINLTTAWNSEKLNGEVGFAYTGRQNTLGGQTQDFLFSPEFITNLTYSFTSKINAGIYYKYTGSLPRFILSEDGESPEVVETDAYSWLDITSTFRFSQRVQLTAGVKNILNVQDIASGGSGTHGSGTSIPVSYGTSGFLRLVLSINK